jgi:hypothetical protein
LTLPDTVKEFNARYGDRRSSETLKPEHRTQTRFHTAIVLFNQPIQIFRRAHLRDSIQFNIGFHLAARETGSLATGACLTVVVFFRSKCVTTRSVETSPGVPVVLSSI